MLIAVINCTQQMWRDVLEDSACGDVPIRRARVVHVIREVQVAALNRNMEGYMEV